MRICLLGTPRCGSQYTVELIRQTIGSTIFDCQEPFIFDNNKFYSIENLNGKIIRRNKKNFVSLADQCNYVINTINSVGPEQDLILRLFLDGYIEPFLPTIIKALTSNNFQFISMKRLNVENQLLSFAIACATNQWNTINNMPYTTGKKYTINPLKDIPWLNTQLIKYEDRLSSLNIEYSTIRYEYLISDLTEILQIPIISDTVRFKKQIVGDPYDIIENANEVREFIKRLLNDTTIH